MGTDWMISSILASSGYCRGMTPTSPGPYLYRDRFGGPPQEVLVYRHEDGQLAAVFQATADEEAVEVLVVDLAGSFEPAP